MFDAHTAELVGHYVYRLIDPRNGETFYVGQGKNNRVFHHARLELQLPEDAPEDDLSLKLTRIREIRSSKLEVGYVIHRHGISPESIDEVEAAVIDAYPGLTNIQGGHGSADRGPVSPKQIMALYDLTEVDLRDDDRIIFLSVGRIEDTSSLEAVYASSAVAWKLNVNRARQADYVVPVKQGRTLAVFKPTEWLAATHANFPQIVAKTNQRPDKWGFKQSPVEESVRERLVGENGKRLPKELPFGSGQPIRYYNI